MRVYLVIVDETKESHVALRFAARRAAKTGGVVQILALVPKQAFSAFGAVQATIEEEARDRAEVLASSAAGELMDESGKMPQIAVRTDEKNVIIDYMDEHPEIAALVLAAAAENGPGPLVTHFSSISASLPCPLFVVPGGLTAEDLERLS